MRRLPVYVMTAAIAMAGATTMTSQASVRPIVIGGSGNNCNTSWKQLTGNSFNGIKLPNCNSFGSNGCGFSGMNQQGCSNPAGCGLSDMGIPCQQSGNACNSNSRQCN